MLSRYPIKIAVLLIVVLLASHITGALAQSHTHIHISQDGGHWDFPIVSDSISDMGVSGDLRNLQVNLKSSQSVPFPIEQMDSMTFENEPATESKDHYKVFPLYITTADGSEITSRDYYTPCHLSLGGLGSFSNYSGTGGIRGRGNSSFLWYDKKPFRIKLDDKHKMLGLPKAKSWVLLANYRDVTDMMNTFVFEMGEALGLAYTNHTRYVELFVNGDYRGVYQLTEQVQQNSNRVAISKDRGILISLDVDDGPGENPYADDNFWSEVYRMPVSVKYPDDEYFTTNTVDSVRAVFGELEHAIKSKNYEQVKELLDIPSFIKYLQIQEFVYNVELSAPRSIFMYKDGDGKWFMGPLWDFDAGYDFDWSQMTTGHNYFADFRETVMGTNPLKRNGNYSYVPQFFTDLFGCKEFVEAYKAQWAAIKDTIVTHSWGECMKYVEQLRASGAIDREMRRWPLAGKNYDEELDKMYHWLQNRLIHMSYLIAAIPVPDETPTNDDQLCGTINVQTTMDWNSGFDQASHIAINKQQVLNLMGVPADEFQEANLSIVPLNNDNSEGENHTNGTYGAWYDADGNTCYFNDGHVYIEVFHNLWNWNCGLYQYNCFDDHHTVSMQYQYPHNGTLLKVNVDVNFTITHNWW